MTLDIRLLLYSILLNWLMIMFAATVNNRLWSPSGFVFAVGNRDKDSDASPMALRASRAANNMKENLLLFAVLLLAARVAGVGSDKLVLPAQIFFYARLAYFPVYVLGITWIRTAIWSVAVVGMGMIAAQMLAL